MGSTVRRPALWLLAVALLLVSAGCAEKPPTVKFDETTVLVRVGDTVGFELKGTTWTFHESSNPYALTKVMTHEPSVICAPEIGCGVSGADYKGIAPGTAVVIATRDICDGRRCLDDEGVHRSRVVVFT